MRNAASCINLLYGESTVELTIREQYRNMKEVIDQHPEVVARAQDAIRKAGLSPVSVPVRGGTDGARLCYMGLPCPNLGTGGANYHGTHEYADADEMRQVVEILKEIVRAR
jgi:tripeptide aminopeptidase